MEKVAALVLCFVLPGLVVAACGGQSTREPATGTFVDASVIDRARLPAPIVVTVPQPGTASDASVDGDAGAVEAGPVCTITIDTPPLLPASHVAIPTEVTYSSNPPSSGPHYPIWAAYKTWPQPVDRRYSVHNLEHGAIVFAYQCADDAGCADVVAALEAAAATIPTDPICVAPVRVRTVITPDPLLDVPIAAAAWGWTYKADCLDLPSLSAFAQAHYGQGTEMICSDGQDTF